jgi:hypothetical protein
MMNMHKLGIVSQSQKPSGYAINPMITGFPSIHYANIVARSSTGFGNCWIYKLGFTVMLLMFAAHPSSWKINPDNY